MVPDNFYTGKGRAIQLEWGQLNGEKQKGAN